MRITKVKGRGYMCAAEVMKVQIKTEKKGEEVKIVDWQVEQSRCVRSGASVYVRFSETHEKRECVLCVCNCVFYVYKSI